MGWAFRLNLYLEHHFIRCHDRIFLQVVQIGSRLFHPAPPSSPIQICRDVALGKLNLTEVWIWMAHFALMLTLFKITSVWN